MTISTSLDVSELHQEDVEPRGSESDSELPSTDAWSTWAAAGVYRPLVQKMFSQEVASRAPFIISNCEALAVSSAANLGMWNSVASMTPALSHSFAGAVLGQIGQKRTAARLFSLEAAEHRLAQIQALTMPSLFSEGDDEDEQLPLSDSAIERAKQLFRALDSFPPIGHIGIFPMPNGGIQLQRSGADSSVSIEIPPDDHQPVLVEFASRDTYWSKRLHGLVETTLMLVRYLR